ncbi:hypothetical protein ACWGOE_02900 [Leucobacter chromiiresistens]
MTQAPVLAPFGARITWRALGGGEDRRTVAHALLAALLAPGAPGAVRITRQCPSCGSSAHGAPAVLLRDPRPAAPGDPAHPGAPADPAHPDAPAAPLVGIGYAPGLVAVAAAPAGARAFGIDLELDDARTRARVAEALGRSAGVCDWTRIEAIAKARRTGLRGDYAGVDVTPLPDGRWIAHADRRRAAGQPGAAVLRGADLRIAPAPGGPAAILSLACE